MFMAPWCDGRPGLQVRARHGSIGATVIEPVSQLLARLEREAYVADPAIATALHLAQVLQKPLLIEGPSGVGKTEIAKVLAGVLGAELIRLQCYEGLDAASALYEWN